MSCSVVALLAVHNRKEKTLACLAALHSSIPDDVHLGVVLVDDGSTDGTAEAVSTSYPGIRIVRGDGSLFWNKGMHLAHQVAAETSPDFVLWLNDDTILVDGALGALISVREKQEGMAIVVGATVDAASGALTYGGLVPVSALRKFNYSRLPLHGDAQECVAMNGNIVLVPRGIYERLGPVDPKFAHALGDIDYALRARRAGFKVVVAPGWLGCCSANSTDGTHFDPRLPIRDRWAKFKGRKGLPFASWRHFVRRHGGALWPLYLFAPYVNFAGRLMLDSIRSRP